MKEFFRFSSSFMRRSSEEQVLPSPIDLDTKACKQSKDIFARRRRESTTRSTRLRCHRGLTGSALCLVRRDPLRGVAGPFAGVPKGRELPESPPCSGGEQSGVAKARWSLERWGIEESLNSISPTSMWHMSSTTACHGLPRVAPGISGRWDREKRVRKGMRRSC